jgi:SPP1 gp7 family putative phage head morphogenesis protein
MPNLTDQLAEELVSNDVDVHRYIDSLNTDIQQVLTDLEAALSRAVAQFDPSQPIRTAYQQARLEALLAHVKTLIAGSVAEAQKLMVASLKRFGNLQEEAIRLLMNDVVGIDLVTGTLTKDQLNAIFGDVLIDGARSAEWWKAISTDLSMKFTREMRKGMVQGESMVELARRVEGFDTDGVLAQTRVQAKALVRTSVQTVNNSAHIAVYQRNADVIKGIQWVSTLDTRTTPICRALDGLQWTLDLQPIGHKFPFPGATAHWGCRSTQVPVMKSWAELAAEQGGNKRFLNKLDEMDASTRASMDGQVSGSLNYEDWLKRQSKARQLEVLGPARYDLWKRDKLNFRQMVSQDGNPLTLDELETKIRRGR